MSPGWSGGGDARSQPWIFSLALNIGMTFNSICYWPFCKRLSQKTEEARFIELLS